MIIASSYVFSPGGPGEGTITLPTALEQESLGEIINVTRGILLYDPLEESAGLRLAVEEGVTIITLEQSTTFCSPTDKLQIQVYGSEGGGGGVASDVTVTNTGLNPVPVASTALTSIDGKLPGLENGGMPVSPVGVVDLGNSTSSNLGSGAVFTGVGTEASPFYGTISVCILSSHASATNGLKFQASIDNVNWETIEQYSYTGGSGLQSYSFAPSGRYFRLTYTNGAQATTKLAIFTVLRSGYTKSSSHRISDIITGEKDAELVKAVLAAMKPNGDFTDIHATAGGNLKVSIEETEDPPANNHRSEYSRARQD